MVVVPGAGELLGGVEEVVDVVASVLDSEVGLLCAHASILRKTQILRNIGVRQTSDARATLAHAHLRLRGAGTRRAYRLLQRADHGGVYLVAAASSLDELAAVLDERGILMWPSDGCE